MANVIRSSGNTQAVAANTTSQTLTFQTTGNQTLGSFLVTAIGNTMHINIGTANTTSAQIANVGNSSPSIPVLSGTSQVIATGQNFNQDPGNVYVAVVSIGTGTCFVTPVAAQ